MNQTNAQQPFRISQPENQAVKMYANFWHRLGAFLIDVVIIYLIFIIFTLFSLGKAPSNRFIELYQFLPWVFYFSYNVLFIGLTGQTLGKIFMRIKVIKADGNKIGWGLTILRETIGKLMSIIPLGFGFLWIFFDIHRQGWHDKIAQSVVIKASQQAGLLLQKTSKAPVGRGKKFVRLAVGCCVLPFVSFVVLSFLLESFTSSNQPIQESTWDNISVSLSQTHYFDDGKPGHTDYKVGIQPINKQSHCGDDWYEYDNLKHYETTVSDNNMDITLKPTKIGGLCKGALSSIDSGPLPDPRRLIEKIPDPGKPVILTIHDGEKIARLKITASDPFVEISEIEDPKNFVTVFFPKLKRGCEKIVIVIGPPSKKHPFFYENLPINDSALEEEVIVNPNYDPLKIYDQYIRIETQCTPSFLTDDLINKLKEQNLIWAYGEPYLSTEDTYRRVQEELTPEQMEQVSITEYYFDGKKSEFQTTK